MTGLFFCLASAEGARLLFCPATMQPHKRLQRVLCCLCSYTAHAAKQRTELCRGFSCNSSYSTAHDNRPTQAAIIPSATRWSVCQHPDGLHRYKRYQRHAGRCAAQHNRPIIIMYIRVQRCAPVMDSCQPGGVSILPTPGGWRSGTGQQLGRTAGTLHPARQSSSRDAAGGAEPLAALAVSLFGLSPDS